MARKVVTGFLLIYFVLVINLYGQNNDQKLSYGEARILLLKSVVFPGWGEHSLDRNSRGYVFNFIDIGLWLGYLVQKHYGKVFHDAMVAYAVSHAGVEPEGKDVQFYTDIGNYLTIYDYNDQKLRYRQVRLVYPVTKEYYWAWDSDASRKHFDRLRIKSGLAYRNASIFVACLVVNRLASVIDIIALTRHRLENAEFSFKPIVYYLPDGTAGMNVEVRW
ncbi:MAG: hypothetical protein DRP91_00495 [Candidatus Neomarinimicrobiota bacterium]|nr:hypothetical protein [Candidatus Neomarinimicrobiota bacterium]RKY50827.1 MAG: hypothetical protein DRP91_00495 [Candidatus Neomarinimicrobiota bacterium]